MVVLFLYDQCLVLDHEIKFIWCQQYSTASLLYVTLKVLTTMCFTLAIAQNLFYMDCHVCICIFNCGQSSLIQTTEVCYKLLHL